MRCGIKLYGRRCEGQRADGERCGARAFAMIAAVKPGALLLVGWLCGPHQVQLRKRGYALHPLQTWRIDDGDETEEAPDAPWAD